MGMFVDATDAMEKQSPAKSYAIVIHGGAGRAPSSQEAIRNRQEVLEKALSTGERMLKQGEPALDVVETVIRVLEDSPWFNAGKGSVFNAAGGHELDASIMDGRDRSAGAVGGVSTVKNPISLARRVMTDTRHVLLVTDGAEQFADLYQDAPAIERVKNDYFSTDHRRKQLERVQEQERQSEKDSIGTVGCVALDRDGNLAAGTSTGGLTNKRFSRIGDSPIIGAGTYADNESCGVSCTGIGEDYIRHAVAYDVAARIRYRGESVTDATKAILADPQRIVRGGIIAISRDGEIAMAFNTEGMSRAAADSSGRHEVIVKAD
jgi:beta-aspartyl-peptidase (threonine type)